MRWVATVYFLKTRKFIGVFEMKKNVLRRITTSFIAAACAGAALAFLSGCTNDPNGGGASSAKQLTKFSFEKAHNTGFTADVKGNIDELAKVVNLVVPNGTDVKKLKASFTVSAGARVFVENTAQESGKTENDFTNIVKYTVIAEDGSKQVYAVSVKEPPKITEFSFLKAVNTALTEDVKGLIGKVRDRQTGAERLVIFIKLPIGTTEATMKALKPTFLVSTGASVSIGGTKIESGKTPADFSDLKNGIDVTVTAEDGAKSTYNVAVEVDYPTASTDEVKKYFGSYSGTIKGLGDVIIVLEAEKVTLFSKTMSMDYGNVEWEKIGAGAYSCTTYSTRKGQKMPHIKNLYGKGGYSFTEKGGKLFVTTNIMGSNVTAEKDATTFVWTEESGYKAVSYHL